MAFSNTKTPIDYLVIGHITEDLLNDGTSRLGGTVSFSGLTAARLGHRVGILTSCTKKTDLSGYDGIQVQNVTSGQNTSFRNINTESGRIQYMFHRAAMLDASVVPNPWKKTAIVHLGPVAAEIDPDIYKAFPNSLICLTPQGWLRAFADDGRVRPIGWSYGLDLLRNAHAIVLSLEDLHNDESMVQSLASTCKILAVTENHLGARIYWNGDVRRFPAPEVSLVEDIGAGDIFAACFFHRLHATRNPWESARFAVQLATQSITREHFKSIPTQEEIALAQIQVI